MFISLLLVAIIATLWANGRFWRSRWTRLPSVEIYATTTGDYDTVVVVWCGAYSDTKTVYWRHLDILQGVGRVCFVNSPRKGYDPYLAMLAAYEELQYMPNRPTRIVLSGLSLGGQEALRFVQHNEEVRAFNIVGTILRDVPMGTRHLRNPLAPYAKYIRSGPLFDLLLSRVMMRAFFKPLITDEESGVDVGHREHNLAVMHALPLSGFAEESAAVAAGFSDYIYIEQMPPTVLVYCSGKDDVIDGKAAKAELQGWLEFKGAHVATLSVEGGHAQVVEKHNASRAALISCLRRLGLAT